MAKPLHRTATKIEKPPQKPKPPPKKFAPPLGSRSFKVHEPKTKKRGACINCSSEGIIAGRGLCVKCYQTPAIREKYKPQFVMTKQTENEDYGLYSVTDAIRKKPHAVENWNLMRSELRGYLLAVSDALEKLEVLSGGKLGIPLEWNEIVLLVNSLPKAVLDEGAKKS